MSQKKAEVKPCLAGGGDLTNDTQAEFLFTNGVRTN